MPLAWPGTLPQQALYEGFTETMPYGVIRTAMDAGPAKQRRRFTAVPRKMTIRVVMTNAQVAVFEDFYLNGLNGGEAAFTWTHPRTGAAVTYRFVAELPPYQISPPDDWLVTLPLEIPVP